MHRFISIVRFSWPFVRPYWGRAAIGILMGALFGLSNAGVVWLTKSMLTRMESPKPIEAPADPTSATPASSTAPAPHHHTPKPLESVAPGLTRWLKETAGSVKASVEQAIDPWLPRKGRPLDVYQVISLLVFLPLAVCLRSAAGYLSTYCMTWTGQHVINDLRVRVLEVLSGLSLDFFNRSTLGELTTRLNSDTKMLERCLSHGVEHIVKDPVTIVSVFTLLCFIDWKLTLSSMALLPVCLIPILILSPKAREATRKMRETGAQQASGILEMLSGIRVVKAFHLESQLVDKFRRSSRRLISQAMRSIRATELTSPIIETVSIFGIGVLLAFVIATDRSIPDLVAFFVGLIMFYDPVKKLAKLHLLIVRTNVGIERLTETLAEVPTVREPQNPARLAAFQTGIQLQNVSFHYGEKTVLENLTLEIPRGWKLGVAGESGSGKSTLVNLLFRFFDPVEGVIRIDGHDLRSIATSDLRNLMALVSQEVVIFDQSVYDNIACGKTGATKEEVIAAARNAYAHEFILDKPEGYTTRLGERGVKLSGGQRQRIAIARAFIRDAPILILDEATAALDSQSEAEVQRALDHLSENRTVISIAHRLSTLANCDEIVVLSRGRLVERGTFEDLLKRDGHFAVMARKQGIFAPAHSRA